MGVSPEPLQPPMWMNMTQMLLMEGETGAPREKPTRAVPSQHSSSL